MTKRGLLRMKSVIVAFPVSSLLKPVKDRCGSLDETARAVGRCGGDTVNTIAPRDVLSSDERGRNLHSR